MKITKELIKKICFDLNIDEEMKNSIRFAVCKKKNSETGESKSFIAILKLICKRDDEKIYNQINFDAIEQKDDKFVSINVGSLRFESGGSYTMWLINWWVTNEDYKRTGIGSMGLKFLEEYSLSLNKSHIEGNYRPNDRNAYPSYMQNNWKIFVDGNESFVCKNLVPENIYKNIIEIDGVKIYEPFDKWIKTSESEINQE